MLFHLISSGHPGQRPLFYTGDMQWDTGQGGRSPALVQCKADGLGARLGKRHPYPGACSSQTTKSTWQRTHTNGTSFPESRCWLVRPGAPTWHHPGPPLSLHLLPNVLSTIGAMSSATKVGRWANTACAHREELTRRKHRSEKGHRIHTHNLKS